VPFTLAHPAAVLPLRGVAHLRAAPLIIGAMTPDLPDFLPGGAARYVRATHVFAHSFSVDLLLGYAALVAIFLLQRPLTAPLWPRARALCLRALEPFRRPSAWAWAGPAILLGVWTHLLWDSFTHPEGWIVLRVPALTAAIVVGPYHGPVYHTLQYLSSIVGLCVMVLWYDRLPTRGAGVGDKARSPAGPVLLLVVAAALLIGGVRAAQQFQHERSVYHTLDVLCTDTLKWFAVLYLTAGFVLTLEHRAGQRGVPSSIAQ
jgi:Domain of unknown function (DUF4184)